MMKNYKVNFNLPYLTKEIDLLLSSFCYFRTNKFFRNSELNRIQVRQKQCKVNIQKSEILIIKLSTI